MKYISVIFGVCFMLVSFGNAQASEWDLEFSPSISTTNEWLGFEPPISFSLINNSESVMAGYRLHLFSPPRFDCIKELSGGSFLSEGEIIPNDIHIFSLDLNSCPPGQHKLVFRAVQASPPYEEDPNGGVLLKQRFITIETNIVRKWEVVQEDLFITPGTFSTTVEIIHQGKFDFPRIEGSIFFDPDFFSNISIQCECEITEDEVSNNFAFSQQDSKVVTLNIQGEMSDAIPAITHLENGIYVNLGGDIVPVRVQRFHGLLIPTLSRN